MTKGIKLIGGDGYHDLLHVQVVQKYGVSNGRPRFFMSEEKVV